MAVYKCQVAYEYKKEKQFFQNDCVFSKIGKMFCTMLIIWDVSWQMFDLLDAAFCFLKAIFLYLINVVELASTNFVVKAQK